MTEGDVVSGYLDCPHLFLNKLVFKYVDDDLLNEQKGEKKIRK